MASAMRSIHAGCGVPDQPLLQVSDLRVEFLGETSHHSLAFDGDPIEFTVKIGDKVLISKYGGTDVKLDGQDLLIINESDILGVIEN